MNLRGFSGGALVVGLVLGLGLPACRCEKPHQEPDAGDAAVPDAGQDAGTWDGGLPNDAGVSDAGTPDAGLPESVFCAATVEAYCAWALRCGKMDQAQVNACEALNAWQCLQPGVDLAVDAGKVLYDPSAAAQCATDLALMNCAPPYPNSPACAAVFIPNTPVGGACTRQWSTMCDAGYCQDSSCPSVCANFLAPDAGCTGLEGDECGPLGYCAFGSPRVCMPYVLTGNPCNPTTDQCLNGVCDTVQGVCLGYGSQELDAGCGSSSVCGTGLYCNGGTCAPLEASGGPCQIFGGTECQPDLTCRSTDGGNAGSCVPRSDAGEPCYGVPTDCLDGLACTNPALFVAGTCVTSQSEDGGCDPVIQNCKVGLLCDSTTNRCRTLPSVDQPCTRDPNNFVSSDCLGGFCPPGDGGQVCQPPQDAGAPCARPWECASGDCENGVCADICGVP